MVQEEAAVAVVVAVVVVMPVEYPALLMLPESVVQVLPELPVVRALSS
jgi:hypothetical protein